MASFNQREETIMTAKTINPTLTEEQLDVIAKLLDYTLTPIWWQLSKLTPKEQELIGNQRVLNELRDWVLDRIIAMPMENIRGKEK